MKRTKTDKALKRPMRLGIKFKSIAVISVLTTGLAFSLMWMSVYYGSRSVRDELSRRGSISTNNLAYNATYATLIGDTTTIADLLGGLIAEKEVLYARVLEPNGTILAERIRTDAHVQEMESLEAGPLHQDDKLVDHHGQCEVGDQIHFQAEISIGKPVHESEEAEFGLLGIPADTATASSTFNQIIGYAQIGMTQRYIEETIGEMRAKMIWITTFVVLLAMLTTSMIVRMAIHPIKALVGATGRVAAGDYDCKVEEFRNDEIGDLANSFNKMTADLKLSREALVEKELLEAAIVELKETQQQLVQAGKMAAIGQLAAGVAHEINNPLAGIMGYAQLATEQLRSRCDTGLHGEDLIRFRNYVENMEKQSQRCKQIVQNLLRFARASSREDTSQVNVNEVVQETLSFIDHQMSTMRIEVVEQLEDDLPAVYGHAGKLQQVFTNIIINATQAIHDGGRVDIQTALLDNRVSIRISDDGEGISKENLEKIFEPFFTTKEIGQGTGLGLSVTYGLVRNMGGEISVESTVGEGTTFAITLPVARDREPGTKFEQITQPIAIGEDSAAKESPPHV